VTNGQTPLSKEEFQSSPAYTKPTPVPSANSHAQDAEEECKGGMDGFSVEIRVISLSDEELEESESSDDQEEYEPVPKKRAIVVCVERMCYQVSQATLLDSYNNVRRSHCTLSTCYQAEGSYRLCARASFCSGYPNFTRLVVRLTERWNEIGTGRDGLRELSSMAARLRATRIYGDTQ
jgi:hypothetical protein